MTAAEKEVLERLAAEVREAGEGTKSVIADLSERVQANGERVAVMTEGMDAMRVDNATQFKSVNANLDLQRADIQEQWKHVAVIEERVENQRKRASSEYAKADDFKVATNDRQTALEQKIADTEHTGEIRFREAAAEKKGTRAAWTTAKTILTIVGAIVTLTGTFGGIGWAIVSAIK